MSGNTPTNELQIYTWMDASLKELTGLVKEVRTALCCRAVHRNALVGEPRGEAARNVF